MRTCRCQWTAARFLPLASIACAATRYVGVNSNHPTLPGFDWNTAVWQFNQPNRENHKTRKPMKANPASQTRTPNSADSRAAQIRSPKPDPAQPRLEPIGNRQSAISDWRPLLFRCTSALLLAVAVLAGTRNARAVVNDNFASALTVSAIPYTNNSSNADATREPGEPYHYGSTNGHSVWWSWTAPSSGSMQVNCTGSSIRSVVGIYTGSSVSNLTAVSSGRGNHIVDFVAVGGTTYQIALDSLDAGSFGNFTFRLLAGVPPPVNDAFTNATVINGHSYTLSGFSIAGATKEPGEPAHAGDPGGKSVWWKWTAPAAGPFQLETTGSTFDTLLAVYTGSSVTNLSLIASNDNYSGQTSLVTFTALAGTDYWFVVDGWAGREGLITMNLMFTPDVPLHFEGLKGASTNAQSWFQFQLLGPAGSTAVVQTVTSLNSANWMPVVTNVLTSSPWTVTVVHPATNAPRFFRAFLVK